MTVELASNNWIISSPNSLRVDEPTYLRSTAFAAVIVQVKILHIEQIFDVALSVASSRCAT